jgi:hypothetical protein
MDNDNKRDGRIGGQSENLPSVDSANRARNRTVMLTPEMTGQVRARLSGDYDPSPGGASAPRFERLGTSDPGWDDAQRVQLQSRGTPAEKPAQLPFDDDEAEWARPIEPAMISEGPSSNGRHYPEPEDQEPAWSSSAQEQETREYQPPRVVRQQPEPSYNEPQYQAPRNEPVRSAYDRAPAAQSATREESVRSNNGNEEVFWKNLTPLVGFLVTFDHDPLGSYIELRSGRLIVTSEREASGNCLLINDPSVSPMHAIMRVSGSNTIQILDQLSENGTRIRRPGIDEEELLSGEKSMLAHGDIVMFGERKFHVCLLNIAGA